MSEVEKMEFQTGYTNTLFMCILYFTLGIISIFCNILNLFVFFSNREFREKFIYFIALDFGELVNAISYVLVGSGRGIALLGGYIYQPISVHDCFFTQYWPHSLILGTELPAFCIILISIERMCAVLRPGTYKRIFYGKFKKELLALVPLAGLISLVVAGISATGPDGSIITQTRHCAIIGSTSGWYSTYHFTFIVLAYVISFISMFTVWSITSKFSSSSGRQGGDHKLVFMMVLTGSSIFLFSLPSIVMLCIRWNIYSFNDVIVSLTYAMPGFLSIVNTIINFLFRPEMRKQFLYLIGLRDSKSTPSDSHHSAFHSNGGHHAVVHPVQATTLMEQARHPLHQQHHGADQHHIVTTHGNVQMEQEKRQSVALVSALVVPNRNLQKKSRVGVTFAQI